MANILTAVEAATVLRCETTDADMLALLPLVDGYIKNATGRDWTIDAAIRPEAKSAARMLLVRWHEDPGSLAGGGGLMFGLSACLVQLEALAITLERNWVPEEALEVEASMPFDGADEMAVTATPTLIFNHAMANGATAAVTLAKEDGTSVVTTNSLDTTGKILRVKPDSNLSPATDYVLTILAAADVYGQTITKTISFRTA